MRQQQATETNEFERKRLLKIHFLVGFLNACLTICIRSVANSLNQFCMSVCTWEQQMTTCNLMLYFSMFLVFAS